MICNRDADEKQKTSRFLARVYRAIAKVLRIARSIDTSPGREPLSPHFFFLFFFFFFALD